MSLREVLLWGFIIVMAVWAWRDWFFSLCGLIVLMAVIEHPDMPKTIAGIQGLNPWNCLLLVILTAWFFQREHEGLVWDLPRPIGTLLLMYLAVLLVAFARMMADRSHMEQDTVGALVSEHLINAIKWVVPGLLLFDGCRTKKRMMMAVMAIVAIYVLLAVQVIRWMPPSNAFGGGDLLRARRRILSEVGYDAVNLSRMLAGGSWAIVCLLPLVKRWWARVGVACLAVAVLYGQALTGGRMGYATWAVLGLILCALRWRKYLWLTPVAAMCIMVLLPGVRDRLTQGFGEKTITGEEETNEYEVLSGRMLAWEYVVEKIAESPVIGYGKEAMVRTGLFDKLWFERKESFPHPHNAYLQLLFDAGVIGLLMVMPFYFVVVKWSGSLFLDRSHPWCGMVGGVALSLVLAYLIAGFGSQTFYPREGEFGMWAALGLMLRLHVERQRAEAYSYGGYAYGAMPLSDGVLRYS